MRIAVCVITYQRPEGLARLLDGLNRLTFAGIPPDLRIVVVENDEAGPAKKVCEEVRSRLRWPLEYTKEPCRGIPYARNKAVACAKDEADFVAFIDDDEVPEPNWLDELIHVQREYDADVVTGPVLPHFMDEVPAWIVKGRFYERQRHATGTRLDRAFTNNVIFRAAIFDKMDPIFEERMAMTGGSDGHFSRRVHQAGYRIVWADEAVVHDWLPASRVNGRWILQRAYRIGTTTAFIELDIHPFPKAVARLVSAGCMRLIKGTLLLPLGCVLGKRRLIQYTRFICYGAGMLAGLLGARYQEYRRTHGA